MLLSSALLCVSALCGWIFDLPALYRLRPTWPAMVPLTALSMLLICLALWPGIARSGQPPWRTLAARICAGCVLLIALLVLSEYALDRTAVRDQLLPSLSRAALVRPAPITTVCLLLLGSAALLISWPSRRRAVLASFLALLVGLISLVSLLGYLNGVVLFNPGQIIPQMSLPTALIGGALALSVLGAPPHQPLLLLIGPEQGSVALRRLILLTLLPALLIAQLTLQRVGTETLAAASGLLLLLLCNLIGLAWFAQIMNRHTRAQHTTLRELALRTTQIELYTNQLPAIFWVVDHQLHFTSVSGSGLQELALNPATLVGQPLQIWLNQDRNAAAVLAAHRRVLAGGTERYTRTVAERNYEIRVTPLHNQAQTVIGAMGMAYDVTERMQAEQTLKRYLDRQAALRAVDQAILNADSPLKLARLLITPLRALLPLGRIGLAVVTEPYGSLQIYALEPDTDTLTEQLLLATPTELEALRDGQLLLAISGAPPQAVVLVESFELADHWMSAPIVQRDQLIGALCVCAAADQPLSADQHSALQEVAGQLAVTLDRLRLIAQISEGRARLQELTHRLVETQEAERYAIASDLHDEVGQSLTGLKLLLELSRRQHIEDQRLAEAQTVVGELLVHVRNLSLDLRPSMLNDSGLLPTLIWLCDRYKTRTGITVLIRHSGLEDRLPGDIEVTAYRVVQEALTNVARHAAVDHALVMAASDGLVLTVCVLDAGCGFDVSAALGAHQSFGLFGIRERVKLLAGRLEIESVPGHGTRLQVELPLTGFVERRGVPR